MNGVVATDNGASEITDNVAELRAGGVGARYATRNYPAAVRLVGLRLARNQAAASAGKGGGADLVAADLTVENCAFEENVSTYGDALAADASGKVQPEGRNEATPYGGAIDVLTFDRTHALTAEDTVLKGNTAGSSSGGSYVTSTSSGIGLHDLVLTDNEAPDAPGGRARVRPRHHR